MEKWYDNGMKNDFFTKGLDPTYFVDWIFVAVSQTN